MTLNACEPIERLAMADKISLKRNISLKTQAEHMRAAELQKPSLPIEMFDGEVDSFAAGSSSASGGSLFDDSIILPAPDTVEDSNRLAGECENSDEDYESEFQQSQTCQVTRRSRVGPALALSNLLTRKHSK